MLPLLLAVLAVSAFGQEKRKDVAAENPLTAHWSKLRHKVDGPKGFTLAGRGMRINPFGQYELWVKIVPVNPTVFLKQYGLPAKTAYVLQYATVDCGKRLLLFEKTAAYDAADTPVSGRVSGIVPSSAKDSVKPGSIGDAVFASVCEDPSLDIKSVDGEGP